MPTAWLLHFFNQSLLAIAAQGLLLTVVILSLRSANARANRLLALFIGMESMHLLFLHLAYSYGLSSPPLLIRVLFGLRVLEAPVLYLYVRVLTEYDFRPDWRLLGHGWVILPVVAGLWYMGSDPGWLATPTPDLQYLSSTILWSMYHAIVFAGYGIVTLGRLDRHLRRLEQALSTVESIGLRWLRQLIVFIIAVDFIHILFDLLRLAGLMGALPKIALNLFTNMVLIYWLAIGGLRQQAVFTEPVRTALEAVARPGGGAPAPAPDGAKYTKSGLHEEQVEAIWEQLQALLREQRPHLDPTLDLPKLARQLNLRPQELSQVINSRSGGSFYDMINRARVEAAKALLREDGQRRKMLDVALSVGFSSQSTFYSQFKKLTGMTPTAYRDGPG